MRTAFLLATAIAAAGVTTTADAVDRDMWLQANGAGICQAALPNYEGQIRKRPLAIQNEGSSPAFVTCSPTSLQFAASSEFGHGVYLQNRSDSPVTVSCTGVMGASDWPAEYSAKSVEIGPESTGSIYWASSDFPSNLADNSTTFNLSCALLPGTGILTVYVNQTVDVGQ
jgi:hypothetical protein